jgi:2,3-bisphosphoglycerate-independent phosphoglycerate mutase
MGNIISLIIDKKQLMTIDENISPLVDSLIEAYNSGEEDETLEPMVCVDDSGKPIGRISDGDYVIFYNIRGEREIELTEAFVSKEFTHFLRKPITTHWATMIEYDQKLNVNVAFPPLETIRYTLSEVLNTAGFRQVKVVESEKRMHITFFMNGKRNEPFEGEEWKIIPSLEFKGYLPPPGMRAGVVSDTAINVLRDPTVDFVVVNWANVDVIGHSEDREAIKQAVSTVDKQLERVIDVASELGIISLVTADHGTVEKWYYPDGSVDTGHTDSQVPFILVAPFFPQVKVRDNGSLIDVAPTILELFGIKKPECMSGRSLLLEKDEIHFTGSRVVLFILDGWGVRDDSWGNLILESGTPVMDRLQSSFPTTRLEAAGEAVGLPNTIPNRSGKTVGNSEVGHLHLGAGRIVPSDRLRIEKAIADGSFYNNSAFRWAMTGAKRDNTNLHLLGIISFYSSHGSIEHLKALLRMTKQIAVPRVYIHGMLGRRGEKPRSGAIYVKNIEVECEHLGIGQFVSLIGRFWSLDREKNWDRIEKSYRWLVHGEGRPIYN